MKCKWLFAALLAATAAHADDRFGPPPQKWLATGGTGFELCDIGVDTQMLKQGQRNLSIACGIPQSPAMRQAFDAAPFWGKRVRFGGWIKTADVEPLAAAQELGGAGLFLGSSVAQGPTLSFKVTGTTEWQYRELVMDVPQHSQWVFIGLSLNGRGQVWARDFKFEAVSMDTPLTLQ